MSGFEWDKNIGQAKLLTNKTTQLYNHCVEELIPRLDQRREWTRCINAYNPSLADVLRPALQTEHAFVMFQRQFVLVYEAKRNLWRLCFVRDLRKKKSTPGGDGGADGGAKTGDVPGPSADDQFDLGGIAAERVAEIVAFVRVLAGRAEWRLRDEAKRLLERTPWLAALFARQRRASLSQLMRNDVVRSRAAAGSRLERRRIGVGGRAVEISSFIPWDGFLFGKTLEQELLCAYAGARF